MFQQNLSRKVFFRQCVLVTKKEPVLELSVSPSGKEDKNPEKGVADQKKKNDVGGFG